MYYVYLGGALVFDAANDASPVSEATISQDVNAAAYLDLTAAPPIDVHVGDVAEVIWDAEALFHGSVTSVTQDTDGLYTISAVSDIDHLNDVLIRPHSTDGTVGEKCPDTLAGYFQWVIQQFNLANVGGYRINVGTNQADNLRLGGLSVSNSQWPTAASVIDDTFVSLGAYLDYVPTRDSGTLSIYSDLHEASSQLIEFGENLIDVKVTRTSDSTYTSIIPYSGDLDISGDIDTATQLATNAGLSISGLAIYDPDAVAEHGYVESRVEISGVETVADLVRYAIAQLRSAEAPTYTIECHAVDMSLYRDGYRHLRVGEAVRVRSPYHGIDEYLAVQDMSLDLLDPSQTSYTLGVSYDTLTGQQSTYLRSLNATISSVQVVADGAAGSVGAAQDAAQAAQDAANAAQSAAEGAQSAASAATDAASAAQSTAQAAQGTADSANQAAQNAQTAAEAAQDAAGDAAKVATNYISASSSGVCVGNMTSGTLGYNTNVSSTQFQIRNGSSVLSYFSASTVSLGTSSSYIYMCGQRASIKYQSSVFNIASNNTMTLGNNANLTINGIDTTVGSSNSSSTETEVLGGVIYIGSANTSTISTYYSGGYRRLTPIYRLSNPYTGVKLYTADSSERNSLISAGWTSEGVNGVGWYAFSPS